MSGGSVLGALQALLERMRESDREGWNLDPRNLRDLEEILRIYGPGMTDGRAIAEARTRGEVRSPHGWPNPNRDTGEHAAERVAAYLRRRINCASPQHDVISAYRDGDEVIALHMLDLESLVREFEIQEQTIASLRRGGSIAP